MYNKIRERVLAGKNIAVSLKDLVAMSEYYVYGPISSIFGKPVINLQDGRWFILSRCEYCGQVDPSRYGPHCASCGAPFETQAVKELDR